MPFLKKLGIKYRDKLIDEMRGGKSFFFQGKEKSVKGFFGDPIFLRARVLEKGKGKKFIGSLAIFL